MRQLAQMHAGALVGVAGASAVLLGALGAHALRNALDPAHYELWHTAVQYHFWHALALAIAAISPGSKARRVALFCFACGIVLFSGSLYLLALGAPHWVGAITPIGGLALMVGWLIMGIGWGRNESRGVKRSGI